MTPKDRTAGFGSTFGAIFGIVLVAAALMISVPIAMNLPESWLGAVLVLCLAGIGIGLIVSHVRLGHGAPRQ